MKNQKGFTLIELMIVVAIIAILAAIALPAYSNYTKKAKVSEVILAASSLRTDVSEYVASNNALPPATWEPDFQQTQYVDKLEWDATTKTITATARNIADDINGDTITLKADDSNVENGVIPKWTCEGSIASKYRPGSCQGEAAAAE
ncbi:TPA: pilin [Stenotrophomonas maltophilia]|jgi:type IV pilus assembly protein PilA|uniref:pilin n=1 Tax=Stenotrophomonas TaxID=40323 RepID=UPI0013DB0FB9|nr:MULTISPECIES: pilin [Stenotrophomonas]MBA0220918.1 pilin [Stenotrophomonas maltophilia]MBH1592364.1 pilin [Stenotrophomonas maltophilia]MDH2023523.1 pilin [Stenotrophomonas sp. GD03680]HEL3750272.1 pilin [Stenotrophomonas maltophilia]HEL7731305.1 pilin [Stenotrophomonas maltophilia]